MSFILTSLSGVPLGVYERTAPCIRLEEGKVIAPGMKRPLDLAPGEEMTVEYPLDGSSKGDPRTLVCVIRRTVDATALDDMIDRLRTVSASQAERIAGAVMPLPFGAVPDMSSVGPVDDRAPKPPVKADAPPASGARRRVVRKTQ